jgi:hypothetical protein
MTRHLSFSVACMFTAVRFASAQIDRSPSDPAAVRESLRAADQAASRRAFADGFVAAILAAADSGIVLLHEGAPIVRGRDRAERLMEAQPSLRDLRMSWEPLRVIVSQDGLFGSTFGTTVRVPGKEPAVLRRYISVWRRPSLGDPWRLVAHVQIGLLSPREYLAPLGLDDQRLGRDMITTYAKADLAFARRAAEAGAPTAFGEYVAPDGMTFAGTGELNIGPATVRARMLESPAAKARWEWYPIVAMSAGSRDLGATIGQAEIHAPDGSSVNYSKYVTIWQRQPDGSLKFVVDGGNQRPAEP